MNIVRLQRNGTLIDRKAELTTDPLGYLGFRIELDTDVTLRSFFRMIDRYPVLGKLNAYSALFMAQFRNAPAAGNPPAGEGGLEFSKTVEMIGAPGDPRLEIYHTLQRTEADGRTTFALKSMPFEMLLDLPLRLGKLKHVVFGDQVDVFEFDTVFSLFEFIDGVSWELSFQGTPRECQLRG